MEFLYVLITPRSIDFAADDDSIEFEITTGSAPTGILQMKNGSAIMTKKLEAEGAATSILEFPLKYDFQDQNGYGLLVATDRINLSGNSSGMAGAVIFNWRIYYRYVTVGAEEYIGIVQSQTMGS